jgi:hypothetical protein
METMAEVSERSMIENVGGVKEFPHSALKMVY